MQYLILLMHAAEHGNEPVWFAEHMGVAGWVVFSLGCALYAGLSAVMCCQITATTSCSSLVPCSTGIHGYVRP